MRRHERHRVLGLFWDKSLATSHKSHGHVKSTKFGPIAVTIGSRLYGNMKRGGDNVAKQNYSMKSLEVASELQPDLLKPFSDPTQSLQHSLIYKAPPLDPQSSAYIDCHIW